MLYKTAQTEQELFLGSFEAIRCHVPKRAVQLEPDSGMWELRAPHVAAGKKRTLVLQLQADEFFHQLECTWKRILKL